MNNLDWNEEKSQFCEMQSLQAEFETLRRLEVNHVLCANAPIRLCARFEGYDQVPHVARIATYCGTALFQWQFDGKYYTLTDLCRQIAQHFTKQTLPPDLQGSQYWCYSNDRQTRSLCEIAQTLNPEDRAYATWKHSIQTGRTISLCRLWVDETFYGLMAGWLPFISDLIREELPSKMEKLTGTKATYIFDKGQAVLPGFQITAYLRSKPILTHPSNEDWFSELALCWFENSLPDINSRLPEILEQIKWEEKAADKEFTF